MKLARSCSPRVLPWVARSACSASEHLLEVRGSLAPLHRPPAGLCVTGRQSSRVRTRDRISAQLAAERREEACPRLRIGIGVQRPADVTLLYSHEADGKHRGLNPLIAGRHVLTP